MDVCPAISFRRRKEPYTSAKMLYISTKEHIAFGSSLVHTHRARILGVHIYRVCIHRSPQQCTYNNVCVLHTEYQNSLLHFMCTICYIHDPVQKESSTM